MNSGNNRAIKAILDAEHQKWKAEQESYKTWGKRETRKERIKRLRKEKDRRTKELKNSKKA